MPMTKDEKIAHGKSQKLAKHNAKLHAIAERRAKAAKLDKAEFIAAIVRGEYRPITAEDIAAEPTPTLAE